MKFLKDGKKLVHEYLTDSIAPHVMDYHDLERSEYLNLDDNEKSELAMEYLKSTNNAKDWLEELQKIAQIAYQKGFKDATTQANHEGAEMLQRLLSGGAR